MTFGLDDDKSLLEDTSRELISCKKIETWGNALLDGRDLINEKLCEEVSGKILMFSHDCTKADPGPLQNVRWNSLRH